MSKKENVKLAMRCLDRVLGNNVTYVPRTYFPALSLNWITHWEKDKKSLDDAFNSAQAYVEKYTDLPVTLTSAFEHAKLHKKTTKAKLTRMQNELRRKLEK